MTGRIITAVSRINTMDNCRPTVNLVVYKSYHITCLKFDDIQEM